MNYPTTIYEKPVIKVGFFAVLHKHLYGFHIVLLRINHPTILTVVWGRPDFSIVFPCMDHHTTLHVRVGLAQARPNKLKIENVKLDSGMR